MAAPTKIESVSSIFRGELHSCSDMIRPENGFPNDDAETNLVGSEHQQKGETHR